MSKSELVRQLKRANPEMSQSDLATRAGIAKGTVAQALKTLVKEPTAAVLTPPDPKKLVPLAVRALKAGAISPASLAASLGVTVELVDEVLAIVGETHTIEHHGSFISLSKPTFGYIPIEVVLGQGDWVTVGIMGDTHLACKEERLDALHAIYDLYASEGITDVFHAGNMIDGYIQRLNGPSVLCSTVDDQTQYVVDNYPARKGITTHFITGDDHESWFMRDGLNWGKMLEMWAKDQGRLDLHYLGHVEADIEFKSPVGSTIMKLQHPGGGSAYARSYTGQKQVESFQGGEKPQILVQGHYHVSNFMIERNVYVVSLPGFQDQTIFARKKKLRMEIGGAILQFKQSPEDGSVARLRIEFKEFFDRGYYKPFLRSDARLVKGHLVKHVGKRK